MPDERRVNYSWAVSQKPGEYIPATARESLVEVLREADPGVQLYVFRLNRWDGSTAPTLSRAFTADETNQVIQDESRALALAVQQCWKPAFAGFPQDLKTLMSYLEAGRYSQQAGAEQVISLAMQRHKVRAMDEGRAGHIPTRGAEWKGLWAVTYAARSPSPLRTIGETVIGSFHMVIMSAQDAAEAVVEAKRERYADATRWVDVTDQVSDAGSSSRMEQAFRDLP